jgi:hypothetical protein
VGRCSARTGMFLLGAAFQNCYCTVKVTVLLFTLSKVAVTLMTSPCPAADDIVPVPVPFVRVRSVVLEITQVTEVVMSCCVLLLGKVAFAVNVTWLFAVGVSVDAVNTIEVGVPSVTVRGVVAGVIVPNAALIVAEHVPATDALGVMSPVWLMVPQVWPPELVRLHATFPVRSWVDPSLNVPVADICRVCTGVAVIVWFCGPIDNDDSVGLTKKPVHPAATASVNSAAANKMARLEFRILQTPGRWTSELSPNQLTKL